MSETLRQHALDILELTGGLPEPEPFAMSPFDPPFNMMENYSCERIRTYGGGAYGFGTIHKIEGGFATALHVTRIDDLDLALTIERLESVYGKCFRFEGTDLHLFGVDQRPNITVSNVQQGDKFTIVGCPAGSSFPEIYHCEYYLDYPQENGHWLRSVVMAGQTEPKAILRWKQWGRCLSGTFDSFRTGQCGECRPC